MKAPIQSKLRTILSLYSPNQNESSSTMPNESFSSSYYARTIPNDDSSLNKSSCSIRGGFTRQKEWNDFAASVEQNEKMDLFEKSTAVLEKLSEFNKRYPIDTPF